MKNFSRTALIIITTSLLSPLVCLAEAYIHRDMVAAENVLRSQLPAAKKKLAICLSKVSEEYGVDDVHLNNLERIALKIVKKCDDEVYRVSQLKTFVWLHLKDKCENTSSPDFDLLATTPECEAMKTFELKYF